MAVEDVHVAVAQAAFQDVLQQRRTLEAAFVAGDHVDDQHFLGRRSRSRRCRRCGLTILLALLGLGLLFRFLGQGIGEVVFIQRTEQVRRRIVEVQVALARFATALAARLARTDLGQLMLVQRGLLVRDHSRRAEQFRTVVVAIRLVGKVAVQLEAQFALPAPHAPPAIEQNAGDHDKPNDDQPFA
ncbi:hypothetical protein D3C81_1401680 [compost metagenome]